MEHIAALLLIVGCSNDLSQCRELPAPTPVFETTASCEAARPFTLDDMAGSTPRLFGTCVPVDPALEEQDGEIVWDVTPGQGLLASVRVQRQPPGLLMAAADIRLEKDYLSQD